MEYTIKHIYSDCNENVDEVTFKNICSEFNIGIIDYILEGKEFNMKSNLSSLSVVRKDRDPRSPKIDWGESIKYKKELEAEGKNLKDIKWHIYYTDEYYCKYYWKKGKCRIPNKSVYRFTPTRGLKGNKEKLITMLKTDDLSYLKFKKHGNI
jgi:hypothetical protein|tara:strand:- start:35670 stop:36125 length:456 start_codon:yes stop_codon:yes gene_type:complete